MELAALRPAPENEQLYRPVLDDDPDLRALAASIQELGVKEPLVISADGYLLSGHRRHAAARLAGLRCVPCRVEPVRRGEPEFLRLLREYNRQRVKTLDEVAREEAVAVDPEEPYRILTEYRKRKASLEVEGFPIRAGRRRSRISKAKAPFLEAALEVLHALRDFWPLTDRQIHYKLLNDPPLKHARKPDSRYLNDPLSYKSLCDLLTRGRLEGRIPWEAIEDATRPVCIWEAYRSTGPFIRRQLDGLLKGFYRDLQQSQPNHIEIVGEKNTIEGVLRPVASQFCIPYTIGRGYASLDPRRKLFLRYRRSGKEKLVLLILSDFDAEGEDIPNSFARSMRDDFGIPGENIIPIKVMLTHAQVLAHRLHPSRLKEKSSRAAWFRQQYGEDIYELEALPPEVLQRYLREVIDRVLDIDAFNDEVATEKRDAAHLDQLRRRLMAAIGPTATGGA